MSNIPTTNEDRLFEILPCTSCGIDDDPADGFGNCTCGNEKKRYEILTLIEAAKLGELEASYGLGVEEYNDRIAELSNPTEREA